MSEFYQQTRFTGVFCASVVMLASYPYFHDTATGAALGGITALLLLGTGIYAVGACRKIRIVAAALALIALSNSIYSLLVQTRGSIWTEASFTAYYGFITIAIFLEVSVTWLPARFHSGDRERLSPDRYNLWITL